MTDGLLLGVDIGSSSSKAVLTDLRGRVVARADTPTGMTSPRPGWYEQDADSLWWGSACALIHRVLDAAGVPPGEVRAVAVSAIGPCVLPLDSTGAPLRPAILYGIDSRASAEVEELAAEHGPEVSFSSQSTVPKMLWLRRHEPEVWARTARVVGAETYLVLRLTGRAVLDRYDASAYRPLFDPATLAWRGGLDDLVPAGLLPELAWSVDVAGHVTTDAAAATGLAQGTPVVTGVADAAAEAIGAGFAGPGDLMIMLGTTGYFILATAGPVPSSTFWPAPGFAPGGHVLAGGMNTVGALTAWFRDVVAGPGTTFASLDELAALSAEGARGLLALPYPAGERTPIADPRARGVLAGLRLDHTRADLYRAVLEGIALGVADNLAAMAEHGLRPGRALVVGGGTGSPVLLQAIADATGLALEVPRETVGAAFGDALRAGVGIGVFDDLAHAAAHVEIAATVAPRQDFAALYRERLLMFRELYVATSPVVHSLE